MTTLALAEVRFRQFLALAKPRVVSLIVFVAMIGMFLAVPGLLLAVPFVEVGPTKLAELAETMKRLGPDADGVRVLFVTIDPERDTQELLSKYVPAFDPRFVGPHGDAEATARTAKEFRVVYQKQPGQTPGTYTMERSAGTFIFDPQGRLRVYVGYGQGPDVFVHNIRELPRSAG